MYTLSARTVLCCVCCSILEAPSASQQVNRKDTRLEASGQSKSYDIHIQNLDVSYGDKYAVLFICDVFVNFRVAEISK